MSNGKKLTTNAGCPVVDNQNVMTAGRRGPQADPAYGEGVAKALGIELFEPQTA